MFFHSPFMTRFIYKFTLRKKLNCGIREDYFNNHHLEGFKEFNSSCIVILRTSLSLPSLTNKIGPFLRFYK